jgi:hypothetical protein
MEAERKKKLSVVERGIKKEKDVQELNEKVYNWHL